MVSEEIKLKLEEYYEAFHKKDWDKFSDCLTDDFSYFTDTAFRLNKKDYVEFLRKDPWQGIEYGLSEIKIHISGSEDLGVAIYRTFFKGLLSDVERKLTAIETSVFVKKENQWKMLHTHISNK